MKKSNRIIGLDILRAMAIIFVVITHMFNYTGILNSNFRSLNWTIKNLLHYISIICVPLFLLLTGYLQSERKLSLKHYSSIIPVLISYFGVSAVNAVLTIRFFGMPQFSEGSGIILLLLHIFDYTFGYAWYVKMYICLFMLIPFLNILFQSLSRHRQKLFIGTLISITMLPPLLKSFVVFGAYFNVMPDFLENMYVITYYYIGAYIAKYKPQPKPLLCLLTILSVLLFESICCWLCSGTQYAWWMFNSNGTITHMLVAVSVFLLFYRMESISKPISLVVGELALCSFEMYLVSYFTDRYLFAHLTLPIWQIVCIDVITAYILAKLMRIILVPASMYIKKLFIKFAHKITKTVES